MSVRWVVPVLAVLCVADATSAQQTTEEFVREHPDQARDSIATALRAALREGPGASVAERTVTELADTYSETWKDPFLAARVQWALALPLAQRAILLTADSLRRIGNEQLFREGALQARVTWLNARRLSNQIDDSVGAARLTGNIGASFYEEGQHDSATALLNEALEAAERFGDLSSAGNAATVLGNIAWERNDLRAAIEFNLQAADLHWEAGDYSGVAADHNSAGLIAEALGDLETAKRQYETALSISERHTNGERRADYLLNLGGVAAARLEIDEARGYFARALERYQAAGETVNEALARQNLGTLEASLSVYETAIAELRHSLALYQAAGHVRGGIEARRLLASIYSAMGRLDEALEHIGEAERQLEQVPMDPALEAGLQVVRGDVELALNRSAEAEAAYERAGVLYRVLGDMNGLAAATQGRALRDLAAQRFGEVIAGIEPVVSLQPPGRERAWSKLLLGAAHAGKGEREAARTALTDARDEFVRSDDRAGKSLALGLIAQLEADDHRSQRGLRLLREAREGARGLPAIQWWLHLRTGRTLEAERDLDGAAAQYDSAISVVESLADWLRFDDRRAMYLEDKWEPYAALAQLLARRDRPELALAVSERMRARYLLDQLARRRSASRPEGALRAKERALSERIAALTERLLTGDAGMRGPAEVGAEETTEELLAVQAEYRRLLDRMREEEPDYLRDLRGAAVSVAAIQRALDPREVLIEYLVSDDQTWIFVITSTRVEQLSTAVGQTALRAQVDFARWALEEQREREDLWRGALRGLDDVLLDPVRATGLLRDRRTVIIIPHLELHYLPFEALIQRDAGGDRYLVQEHDVVYAPSASVWIRSAERSSSYRNGVLALAPIQDELAGTRAEVSAIHAAWGSRAHVRWGPAAGENALTAVPGYRVVHLATRGVLNRHNPLFSYVELHPDDGNDGRLEVHEVLRLSLPTQLLVLSACQTALGSGSVGDVPRGDDWVGLVRAFIHAGAQSVLATLWAVDDLRTADLVGQFHRRVAAGASFTQALAETKREAIDGDGLKHPYLWAGFVLIGGPQE